MVSFKETKQGPWWIRSDFPLRLIQVAEEPGLNSLVSLPEVLATLCDLMQQPLGKGLHKCFQVTQFQHLPQLTIRILV